MNEYILSTIKQRLALWVKHRVQTSPRDCYLLRQQISASNASLTRYSRWCRDFPRRHRIHNRNLPKLSCSRTPPYWGDRWLCYAYGIPTTLPSSASLLEVGTFSRAPGSVWRSRRMDRLEQTDTQIASKLSFLTQRVHRENVQVPYGANATRSFRVLPSRPRLPSWAWRAWRSTHFLNPQMQHVHFPVLYRLDSMTLEGFLMFVCFEFHHGASWRYDRRYQLGVWRSDVVDGIYN